MRTAFRLLLLTLLSFAVFTRAQGREQTLEIPAPPSANAIGTRIDPPNRSEPTINTYVRQVTLSEPTRINRSGLDYYEVKGTIEGIGWGGAGAGAVRYESPYTYKVPYVLRIPMGYHGTLVVFRHGNAAFEAWAALDRRFGPRSIGRVFQDYGDRVVSDAALHPMRRWAYFSVNYTLLALDGRPSSFLLPGSDDDNDGRIDEDPLQDDDGDGLEDEDVRDGLDSDGDGLVDEDPAVDDDGDGRVNEDAGRAPIMVQGDVTIQRDTTLVAKYLLKRLAARAPTVTLGTGHGTGAVMSFQLNAGIDLPRVTGRQLRGGDDFTVAYDSTSSKIFDGFLLFNGNYPNAVIDGARGLAAPSLFVNGEADNTAIGAVRAVQTMLDRGLNATNLARVYMMRNLPNIDSDFVRADPCGPACNTDLPDFFRGAGDRLRGISGALLDALYRWVVDGAAPPQSVFNGIPTDVNGDGAVDSLRFPQSSRSGPASTFFFPFVDDPSLDQASGPLTNMQNNVALASLWASVAQALNARVDSVFLPDAACRRGGSSFMVQGPIGVRFTPYDQRTFLSVWGSFATYQTCRIKAVDTLIASGLYDPTVVTIDIRPDEFPNRVDARSSDRVPVAIFSTIGFDATHINAATLRLGGARPSGDRGEITDVNGDGRTDLVVSFSSRDVTLSREGDVVVDLDGRTWSGLPFSGTDLVDYVR